MPIIRQLKKYDKALNDLTKTIKIHPQFSEIFFNKGLIYVVKGELKKAIEFYTQAIKYNEDNDDDYTCRRRAYHDVNLLDYFKVFASLALIFADEGNDDFF